MTDETTQYWAFCANPLYYRILDAIRECEFDSWNIPRGNVRAGDRAIIWKAKGRDKERGIVALADILTDPEIGLDPNRPYWVDPHGEDEPRPRVTVRYLAPLSLPLWLSDEGHEALGLLSVSRASGGTIFRVTPDQWQEVMDLIGGWPIEPPDVQDALKSLGAASGKKAIGQYYQTNALLRRTVERYAMEKAIQYYTSRGWTVRDVSATQPYDLFCYRDGDEDLRVEVKGTTSDGLQILLTRNEVRHARKHYPHVALFILANIHVSAQAPDKYLPDGGQTIIHEPWHLNESDLTPLAFSYKLSQHG